MGKTYQCARCRNLGKPCTFTHTRYLEADQGLIRALAMPVEHSVEIVRNKDQLMYYG